MSTTLERLSPWLFTVGMLHAGDLDRPAHLVAENDDIAAIGGNEPGHELHQGRLAASRRPDHGAANSPRATVRLVSFKARTPPEALR